MGADRNLLVKDHTHTFVNKGGDIGGMIWCLILCYQILLDCSHVSYFDITITSIA